MNVAAGVGTKKPDGPGFDLAPGKYKFQVERRGAAKINEEITVGADETWGVMIGEFGALALQVY